MQPCRLLLLFLAFVASHAQGVQESTTTMRTQVRTDLTESQVVSAIMAVTTISVLLVIVPTVLYRKYWANEDDEIY